MLSVVFLCQLHIFRGTSDYICSWNIGTWWKQTLWTLIRPREQSDWGPYCLQYRLISILEQIKVNHPQSSVMSLSPKVKENVWKLTGLCLSWYNSSLGLSACCLRHSLKTKWVYIAYVLGTQKDRLIGMVLLSTQNMFWLRKIENIIFLSHTLN